MKMPVHLQSMEANRFPLFATGRGELKKNLRAISSCTHMPKARCWAVASASAPRTRPPVRHGSTPCALILLSLNAAPQRLDGTRNIRSPPLGAGVCSNLFFSEGPQIISPGADSRSCHFQLVPSNFGGAGVPQLRPHGCAERVAPSRRQLPIPAIQRH